MDEEPIEGIFVKGSATRGLILHKLVEEILTGELDEQNICGRARELSHELGATDAVDPEEAATTVTRTLALPRIAAVRARLIAEVDVAKLSGSGERYELTLGTADAVAMTDTGEIELVIDWKSDVDPDIATLNGYRSQMTDYLSALRADRGLIVLMTSGRILEVESSLSQNHAAP